MMYTLLSSALQVGEKDARIRELEQALKRKEEDTPNKQVGMFIGLP